MTIDIDLARRNRERGHQHQKIKKAEEGTADAFLGAAFPSTPREVET